MNRAERRAAARGETARDHRIMQVHEAAHAVGRIFSAEAHDIPVENMVDNIVVRISVATTYGPIFPRVVQDALQKHIKAAAASGKKEVAPVFSIMEIEKAREQGVDIERWLKAKLVMIALGPCAEAKLTGRDTFEVFNSAECRGDYDDAMSTCNYAGTGAQRGGELIVAAIEAATAMLEQPNVWRAVIAVADLVPRRGILPGDTIVRAATAALAGSA
jgi:hypothetical protein